MNDERHSLVKHVNVREMNVDFPIDEHPTKNMMPRQFSGAFGKLATQLRKIEEKKLFAAIVVTAAGGFDKHIRYIL